MRSFLALFRRPSWLAFTAFVVVASLGFYELGVWQLHRHTHQNRVDAELRLSKALAPVRVAELMRAGAPPAQSVMWRKVTATGTYDAAHQFLARNRVRQNRNGYEVLVPLRTAAGIDLIVDRGWIPAGPTARAPAAVPAVPDGEVKVVGRIRPSEGERTLAALPPGQVQRIDPAQIARITGREAYGGFVDLVTETPPQADAPAVLLSPDETDSGGWWKPPHLAYAVQWFLFIIIALVGWAILGRRELALMRAVRPTTPETRPSEGRSATRTASGTDPRTDPQPAAAPRADLAPPPDRPRPPG
jgi:cytochrome oxidase assembly protein ShyY1